MLRNTIVPALFIVAGFFATADAGPEFVGEPTAIHAQRGMVAAEHELASRAGAQVFEQGGNAIDAAVAAAFAIGVVNPTSAGLGGGGFLLFYEAATKKFHALDFRETAPAGAHRDLYLRDGQVDSSASLRGGLAVGVPGEVRGLIAAHERFGSLALDKVMAPAIALAAEGFPVGPHLANGIARKREAMQADPALRARFFRPDGTTPLGVGDQLRRPHLARTLRAIATDGPSAFYAGEAARAIVEAARASGGILTQADLTDYEVRWRPPVIGQYHGHQIAGFPPPSSGGGVIVETLNVLSGDSLATLRAPGARRHLIAEALRQTFADRALHYGDPDFTKVPLDKLLSPEHARALRSRISMERAGKSSAGQGPADDHGTSHLSTADAAGNAVALTSTINTSFGSLVYVDALGIFLNNEMDDFAAAPGVPNTYGLVGAEANSIRAGKRPLSSMSPTIVVRDGRPRLVVGGSGGPRIITATLAVILNTIDLGMAPLDAMMSVRIHHQWKPDVLRYERGLPKAEITRLLALGHEVMEVSSLAAVQAVFVTDRDLVGVSDPRKGGRAAGW